MEFVSANRGQGLGQVKFRPEYLVMDFKSLSPSASPLPSQPGPHAVQTKVEGFSNAALLSLMNTNAEPLEKRIAALQELMFRTPEGLDQAILQALQSAGVDQGWVRALVFAAERVSSSDRQVRPQLAKILLKTALMLRDSPDLDADPPLWSAVRAFGSLAPIEAVHELVVFLDSNRGTTRQVALQAIWAMVERALPPSSPNVEVLRTRVTELATKYLDKDQLVSAEAVSLATFAYCVAVLLGSPSAVDLTRTAVTLQRRRMLRRIREIIREAHDARLQRKVPVDDLRAVLIELDPNGGK